MEKMNQMFRYDAKDVMEQFQVGRDGLSTEQVEQQRRIYGDNMLSEEQKKSVVQVFLEQFKDLLVIILMISIVFIAGENELTTAMAAARNGAIEGLATSSSAIYPEDTYRDYSNSKTSLLYPYSVEIVNISYSDLGLDKNYDKKRIQFKVYAKTSDRFDSKELVSIGDRINYNLRKSVAVSFNSTQSTNKLYNPVFSPHYVYTTANVKWV